MKLEFDSVGELSDFLGFCHAMGRVAYWLQDEIGIQLPAGSEEKLRALFDKGDVDRTPQATVGQNGVSLQSGAVLSPDDAAGNAAAAEGAPTPVDAPAATVTEKPRRTRRTKGEIEAEKNANPFSQPSATAGAALTAEPGDTALTAAAQPEAAMQTDSALRAAANATSAEHTAVDAEIAAAANTPVAPAGTQTPDIWIKQRARELDGVDPIAHMNLCRNFIHKLGMPKYGETFKLTGLSENVMSYDNAQRALHAAALEFVDKHVA